MLSNAVDTEATPHATANDCGFAFAAALSEVTSFLLGRAMALTGQRELAEDLVQETMANAWQARASYAPGTNFKGWLCTILRNEFYSHHRRAWRQAPWCEMFEDSMHTPLGEQIAALDLCDAAYAMNTLPDIQREALVLVGICGFSYKETAMLLGGTLGTVKSRVARARMSVLEVLQTQRQQGGRSRAASSRAFDQWLVELDAFRVLACRLLRTNNTAAYKALAKAPKISMPAPASCERSAPISDRASLLRKQALPHVRAPRESAVSDYGAAGPLPLTRSLEEVVAEALETVD